MHMQSHPLVYNTDMHVYCIFQAGCLCYISIRWTTDQKNTCWGRSEAVWFLAMNRESDHFGLVQLLPSQ